MIGLFLITHGGLGEALVQCACHVMGRRPPQLMHLGVAAQDDPDAALPLARELLAVADKGDGALIMTDIYGATPANVAMKLLSPGRIEGVAGVNLPMLLRAISYREKGMDTLLAKTLDGGRDGVLNMWSH
ncbi:MAG: PTS fructose transporter subunit IIA [Sterolibacterium sp.]|jgi:PTS system mannose-specific IIA component|nr:PTS fructose transporter subunit IIA [Sterolibacterium sp.]MBP9799944.1 PTS fructose transporter subunit IIA [Sterolibacterium sp.]